MKKKKEKIWTRTYKRLLIKNMNNFKMTQKTTAKTKKRI